MKYLLSIVRLCQRKRPRRGVIDRLMGLFMVALTDNGAFRVTVLHSMVAK